MLDKTDKEFIKNEITEAIETFASQIISATAKGFEGMDKRFEAVDKRFDRLDKNVAVLKEDVSVLKGDMRDVKRRLSDLETDAPSNSEFQGHEKRIPKLEQTVLTA
ncbi:hypothetical protein CO053_03645 [Candidatus Shapirobacteria bacterium CG_4_9_14_0_2_um_filter_40_11]|uniref:Uncharacterized protein n=1 Tax=Candidatus Shapirobacteria bacterium CG_4_9_14_0_2_um_filter_40_11 TaxID=1974876 RepID=A0A2M8EU43_9BACT|nr:MAG: hypothetical protein CO053_03645 [Candidatus Shapirobacteria bacterium CG_4_9_14_0_2_um_filter_40_11]